MAECKKTDSSRAAGLTEEVARRALRAFRSPLPEGVLLLARQCVMDWIGVALAGADEPASAIVRAQAMDDGGRPIASVVASDARLSVPQAAMLNGTAGHALDYDDANIGAQGHITAAVLPAALAMAQARHLDGEQLLRAFAAGYDAACTVGHYVGRAHYDRGFHGTGTVGAFGAAVAAALLLGLDELGIACAMGIAGTQAAGLKAQFGTMCKPLHAGKAAENGVRSAQLASRGFTSRTDILESAQGFGEVTSPDAEAERALVRPQGGHHLFANLFKFHAACYGTHSAIDALAGLRRRHGLVPAQVRQVELRVEAAADRMCNLAAPRSGLQAKFSLRLNAALALAGEDTANPATYTDANAARGDLCRLRDAVAVHLMPPPWPDMRVEADLTTVDGRLLQACANSAQPCTDLVLQGERLSHKFKMLATACVGPDRSSAIMACMASLEHLRDTAELMALLEPRVRG